VIPQIAAAPGVRDGTPGRWVNAPGGDNTVSERDELNGLRKAIADLAKERDVLMGVEVSNSIGPRTLISAPDSVNGR
jgi:hypothetical protein